MIFQPDRNDDSRFSAQQAVLVVVRRRHPGVLVVFERHIIAVHGGFEVWIEVSVPAARARRRGEKRRHQVRFVDSPVR